jgi:8-oxo-dGTP pyrophosphatase MutT (NUDIX family)
MSSYIQYLDRWGRKNIPEQNSIIKKRSGAFAILYCEGCILLIWPTYAPKVPDLPGGGIDPGESSQEALQREVKEETGFDIQGIELSCTFRHLIGFYANDVDEYWDYDQEFFLVNLPDASLFFEGSRPTPENGIMKWVGLSEIKELNINKCHLIPILKLIDKTF